MCFAMQTEEDWDGKLLLISSFSYGDSMRLALHEASVKESVGQEGIMLCIICFWGQLLKFLLLIMR